MRILVIILLPVLLYPIIIIYFNKYQDILIRSEFAALERQGLTLTKALALAENQYSLIEKNLISSPALQGLIPKVEYGSNIRAQIINIYGDLIADTKSSMKYAPLVKISPLPLVDTKYEVKNYFANIVSLFSKWISRPLELPFFKDNPIFTLNDFPEVLNALKGMNTKALRKDKNGKLHLFIALPIKNVRMVRGVVLLSVSGEKIEQELLDLEIELFKAFGLILFATLSLSLYFGKSITTPIIKLAHEADKISEDKTLKRTGSSVFELRKDEIGDLARSFSKMTKELQSRVDHIANFAADVAHELKNPITSIRSATETISKIKNAKEQQKLFKVIQNDIQRIDRLINDISAASRLDAELSRIEMKNINIVELLNTLIEIRATTIKCKISFFKEENFIYFMGSENRIAQVFDNLIENAVSFSDKNDVIKINLKKDLNNIIISVEDCGPGFPEGAQEKIFDRFYTERPKNETFGNHSGLGLFISKQIINAHGGSIEAYNLYNDRKTCVGGGVKTTLKSV